MYSLDLTYDMHPCSICRAPILDLPDQPGPKFCPTHPVGRENAHRVEGRIFAEGTRKKLVATSIQRVGLFAAVVPEYEEIEEDIWRVEILEHWRDPVTGKKMGARIGSRPL